MLKKSPSEIQFIMVTLVVVLLLGGPTVWSLVGDGGAIQQESQGLAHRAVKGQRTPASLPPSIAMKAARVSPLTNFDVSCLNNKFKPVAVQDSFVQFQGKNCIKGLQREKIEIINRSNGYTASIFFNGSDRYQTDLIQLKSGENEIHIRYPAAEGLKEEVLKVTSSAI